MGEELYLLAPMAELSHRPLRELIESFGGCSLYFTEMISAPGFLSGGPFENSYIDTGEMGEKVIFQLLGADMEQLVKAAGILSALPCAGIDLNMGCSAPAITRTGAGVRWMASIDRAGELVRKVRALCRRPLSIKLRLGLDPRDRPWTGEREAGLPRNDEEHFAYLLRLCRRLVEEGLDRLTLHPRTSAEKFRRLSRWEYVYRLREELPIPVVGNGDVADWEDLLRRSRQIPSGPVMVGRGAVRFPWIFSQAREGAAGREPPAITAHIIEETGVRFLDLLSRYQPPEFHLSRARRFFSYFCDNLTWGTQVKNRINRESTLRGIEKVWREGVREEGVSPGP